MSTRRESAQALVQRLRATHVRLSPSIFHSACGGGLRHGDVLVVGGPPGGGKSSWAYRVAAHHLASGGSVTFLFLPGSGSFLPRRFVEQLEAQQLQQQQQQQQHQQQCSGTDADPLEAQRTAVLSALQRLEVVHCADFADVAVFCTHSPAPHSAGAAVPLVVVEGCGGRGTNVHHCGRAAGREVPLCHWLFECLQRRRRCALILVEEWSGEWETGSDVLRRLPREKGAAGTEAILGSGRIFLLHVQAVASPGRRAVSVARFMRMNVIETHMEEMGTDAEVTEGKHWKRRRKSDINQQLNADVLCAAQL